MSYATPSRVFSPNRSDYAFASTGARGGVNDSSMVTIVPPSPRISHQTPPPSQQQEQQQQQLQSQRFTPALSYTAPRDLYSTFTAEELAAQLARAAAPRRDGTAVAATSFVAGSPSEPIRPRSPHLLRSSVGDDDDFERFNRLRRLEAQIQLEREALQLDFQVQMREWANRSRGAVPPSDTAVRSPHLRDIRIVGTCEDYFAAKHAREDARMREDAEYRARRFRQISASRRRQARGGDPFLSEDDDDNQGGDTSGRRADAHYHPKNSARASSPKLVAVVTSKADVVGIGSDGTPFNESGTSAGAARALAALGLSSSSAPDERVGSSAHGGGASMTTSDYVVGPDGVRRKVVRSTAAAGPSSAIADGAAYAEDLEAEGSMRGGGARAPKKLPPKKPPNHLNSWDIVDDDEFAEFLGAGGGDDPYAQQASPTGGDVPALSSTTASSAVSTKQVGSVVAGGAIAGPPPSTRLPPPPGVKRPPTPKGSSRSNTPPLPPSYVPAASPAASPIAASAAAASPVSSSSSPPPLLAPVKSTPPPPTGVTSSAKMTVVPSGKPAAVAEPRSRSRSPPSPGTTSLAGSVASTSTTMSRPPPARGGKMPPLKMPHKKLPAPGAAAAV